MSKLSPEAAALLASARKDFEASADVVARVKAAVDARVDGAPPPSGVRLRALWSTVRRPGQVLVLALVGGALASGYTAVSRAPAQATNASALESSPEITRQGDAPPVVSRDDSAPSEIAKAVPSVPVAALPDRPLVRAVRAPAARDSRAPAPAATAPEVAPVRGSTGPTDDLVEETRLLRAAQLDLQARRPDAARRSLDEHALRFPAGLLREEQMTLRVLVLCQAGEIEAARHTRAELDRSFPATSHASRLATSCAAHTEGGK